MKGNPSKRAPSTGLKVAPIVKTILPTAISYRSASLNWILAPRVALEKGFLSPNLFFNLIGQAIQNLRFVLLFGFRSLIPEGDQDFRFVRINVYSQNDFAGHVIPGFRVWGGRSRPRHSGA